MANIFKQWNGRGWGHFIPSVRVNNPSEVKVGDLVCLESEQFKARNLARVTRTKFADKGARFYARFVDPKAPSDFMGNEFCLWDFEIKGSTQVFHVA